MTVPESGHDAPLRAQAAALSRATSARSVILVEGISDQVAIETLAERHDRDLATEGTVVVPIGGAQAVTRHLERFGPNGANLELSGLCDATEEGFFRRGLTESGVGSPATRAEMEHLGFFVCVDDLEEELIRASGEELIEQLLDREGDLSSFRTMQKQPQWRNGDFDAQMHRFLGAGARRKTRYARLLVDALPLELMPRPLAGVIDRR